MINNLLLLLRLYNSKIKSRYSDFSPFLRLRDTEFLALPDKRDNFFGSEDVP